MVLMHKHILDCLGWNLLQIFGLSHQPRALCETCFCGLQFYHCTRRVLFLFECTCISMMTPINFLAGFFLPGLCAHSLGLLCCLLGACLFWLCSIHICARVGPRIGSQILIPRVKSLVWLKIIFIILFRFSFFLIGLFPSHGFYVFLLNL